MGVARWGVCPQGLKPRLIFGGFSRHGQGRALTKVTPNLLPYSANLIKEERVRLRMGQFTANVEAVSGSNFTANSLPSLFTATGITEIQVHSSSSTEFENVSGVGSLMAGNSVSLQGLLFRTSASPTLVAKKVRKR